MTPTVAVLFRQTAPLGVDAAALVAALQAYVNTLLAPAWGVAAKVYAPAAPAPGDWPLVIADDSDQAGALGYHDDAAAGPCGFAFVKTSQRAGEPLSVTVSHELAELLLDPGCNLAARTPRSRWVAREICDPVQGPTLTVNGLPMANFVLPAWFNTGPGFGHGPYDAAGALQAPWQILSGGYIPAWGVNGWTPLFASQKGADHFRAAGKAGRLRRFTRRSRTGPQGSPDNESEDQGSGRGGGSCVDGEAHGAQGGGVAAKAIPVGAAHGPQATGAAADIAMPPADDDAPAVTG